MSLIQFNCLILPVCLSVFCLAICLPAICPHVCLSAVFSFFQTICSHVSCLPICRSVCLRICLSFCLTVRLSTCMYLCLATCLPECWSASLFASLYVCLSGRLPVAACRLSESVRHQLCGQLEGKVSERLSVHTATCVSGQHQCYFATELKRKHSVSVFNNAQ